MIKLDSDALVRATAELCNAYAQPIAWEQARSLASIAIGAYLRRSVQYEIEGRGKVDAGELRRLVKNMRVLGEPTVEQQHALAKWLANCSLSGLHLYARDVKFATESGEDEILFRLRLVTAALNGEAPMHPNLEGLVHAGT